MVTLQDFDHVSNEMLRHLLGYWLDRRDDRQMPARHDIDPIDIPWALAQIWLCDFLPDSGRFRYRIAGEQINDFWGCNIGGRFLDELVPEPSMALVSERFFEASDGPSIVHDAGRIFLTEELFANGERLILPLSENGRTVDALLGATCREWFRDRDNEPLAKSSQTTTVTPLGPAPQARAIQELTLNCSP